MPVAPTYPGVYIEEIPSGVRTITGVPTSITAFVGRALSGPVNDAVVINSFGDYERIFGGLSLDSSMSFAARDFFINGGAQAIIVRLFAPKDSEVQAAQTAAQAPATTAADAVIAAATAARDTATATTTDADVAAAAEGAVAAAGGTGPAALAAATAVAQAARAEVNTPTPSTTATDRDAVVTAAQNAKTAAVAGAAAAAKPNSKARIQAGGLNLEAANEGAWANDLRARVDHDVKVGAIDLFNLSVKNTKSGQIEVHRNLSVAAGSARRVDKVLAAESSLINTRGALPTTKPTANATLPVGVDPFDTAHSTGVATTDQVTDGQALGVSNFLPTSGEINKEGIYALRKTNLFNLLCLPPFEIDGDMHASVITAAAKLCEDGRAMLLVDPRAAWKTPANVIAGIGGVGTTSKNAAIYFPRLRQSNLLRDNQLDDFVPCGAIAGIMARTDATRGVWKAPAGLEANLVGVPALTVLLNDAENGQLNPLGINCLRAMVPAGRIVWGARTLQGDDRLASEWKYVPVRRTALYIEESLFRGTQWVVFEPNDEPLWAQIRLNVGSFMHDLFRQGAFQGTTPKDAYFVKCDKESTTQSDINHGIVNIVVGFAPLKPAEFVIIKLQQMAGQIDV
jgi:phage tail sheath protein FI